MRICGLLLVVAVAALASMAGTATATVPVPKSGHYTGHTNPGDWDGDSFAISFDVAIEGHRGPVTNFKSDLIPSAWVRFITGHAYAPGQITSVDDDGQQTWHRYWTFNTSQQELLWKVSGEWDGDSLVHGTVLLPNWSGGPDHAVRFWARRPAHR